MKKCKTIVIKAEDVGEHAFSLPSLVYKEEQCSNNAVTNDGFCEKHYLRRLKKKKKRQK